MARAMNLGMPRIGPGRELKHSVEGYWEGRVTGAHLARRRANTGPMAGRRRPPLGSIRSRATTSRSMTTCWTPAAQSVPCPTVLGPTSPQTSWTPISP